MYEYGDLMAQLKHPGMSKAMSDIYRRMNIDDGEYPEPDRSDPDGTEVEMEDEERRPHMP